METSFSLDHLCHVHGSSLTWWPCLPISFLFFHRDLFYVLGDVCFYSAFSRWVTCYVVASPLWHVVIWSLVDYSFVLRNLYFDWKIPCTVYVLWLFTIDGCGDYRQVWCVAFFSNTSILVVSFGLHQWIQLVDRISMYLAQLVFCSDCREVTRQRFLSMFSHSSP